MDIIAEHFQWPILMREILATALTHQDAMHRGVSHPWQELLMGADSEAGPVDPGQTPLWALTVDLWAECVV